MYRLGYSQYETKRERVCVRERLRKKEGKIDRQIDR